jgi:hypothetical protein
MVLAKGLANRTFLALALLVLSIDFNGVPLFDFVTLEPVFLAGVAGSRRFAELTR